MIGDCHARFARRRVSHLARQLQNPLSAVLTASAEMNCQAGIRKTLRLPTDKTANSSCRGRENGAAFARFIPHWLIQPD
jgi:hypothetical protein